MALAGVKVISLAMAMCRSVAGMTNRLAPPGSACTRRGATVTESSWSSKVISSTKACQGRRAAVSAGLSGLVQVVMACRQGGAFILQRDAQGAEWLCGPSTFKIYAAGGFVQTIRGAPAGLTQTVKTVRIAKKG